MKAFRPLLCTAVVLLAQAGCTSITPHENFKALMQSRVGEDIKREMTRPGGAAAPSRQLDTRLLENGNREMNYILMKGCVYFFEVNEADIIVDWRFEGTTKTCMIVP